MEYSPVSTNVEEEVIEKKGVSYNYFYPCHFLEEAVRAFFKCLGIESKGQEEKDDDEKDTKTQTQKVTPSAPQVELLDVAYPSVPATDSSEADPSSSTTETSEADPSPSTTETREVDASTTVTLRAARPPISSGEGGQIN